MPKTFLQRCDEAADDFAKEWFSGDAYRRSFAVNRIAEGRNNRTLAAIIFLRLYGRDTMQAHQYIGALSYAEQVKARRKRGKSGK